MRKIKILLLVLILSFLNGGCSPTGLLDSIMDRDSRGNGSIATAQVGENPTREVEKRFGTQPGGTIDVEAANQLLQDVDGSYLVELQNQDGLARDRKLIPVSAHYNNGHLRLAPYETTQEDHLVFNNYSVTNVEGSRVTLSAPLEKESTNDKTEMEEKWQGTSMMQIDVSKDPVVARFAVKYHYEKKSKSILGTWGNNVTESLNMEVKWQAIFSRVFADVLWPIPQESQTDNGTIKGCFPPYGCEEEKQVEKDETVSQSTTTRSYEFISRDDSGSIQLSIAFKDVSELPENKTALAKITIHKMGEDGGLQEVLVAEQEIEIQYGYHLNNVVISKDNIQAELNIVIVPFGEALLGTVRITEGETTSTFGFTEN